MRVLVFVFYFFQIFFFQFSCQLDSIKPVSDKGHRSEQSKEALNAVVQQQRKSGNEKNFASLIFIFCAFFFYLPVRVLPESFVTAFVDVSQHPGARC